MSSTFSTVEGINGLILDSITNNQPVIDSLTDLIVEVGGGGGGGGSINLLSDCYKNTSNQSMSIGHKANINDFNSLCLTISNTPMTNSGTAQTGSTYVGQGSGESSTINAGRNTATGALTLLVCESQGNCAYGFSTANKLTTGSHLCAYGEGSALNLITGSDNSLYGYQTGITLTTGSNNLLAGHNCDVSSGNAQNRIGLGSNVVCNVDNSITTIPNLELIPPTNTLVNADNVRLLTYNNFGQIGPIDNSGTPNDVLKLNNSGNIVWGPVTGGGGGANQIDQLLDAYRQGNSVILGYKPVNTGARTVHVSNNPLPSITTLAEDNCAFGNNTLLSIVGGSRNVCFGQDTLKDVTSGFDNVCVGHSSGTNNSGSIVTGSQNVFIGSGTFATSSNPVNRIVIGNGAIGLSDNSIHTISNLRNQDSTTFSMLTYSNTGQIGPFPTGSSGYVLSSDGNKPIWVTSPPYSIPTAYSSTVFQNINSPGGNLTLTPSWTIYNTSAQAKFNLLGDTITILAGGAGTYEITVSVVIYLINVTGVSNSVTLRTVLNSAYDIGSFFTQKIPTTSEYAGTITNTYIRNYSVGNTIKVNIFNNTTTQLQMDKINVTVKFLST